MDVRLEKRGNAYSYTLLYTLIYTIIESIFIY